MRGVSVGGGGGVDDRVMCFSINWSINASEDWFLFKPCVGSGWGDGDRFRGFTWSFESDEVLGRPFMITSDWWREMPCFLSHLCSTL